MGARVALLLAGLTLASQRLEAQVVDSVKVLTLSQAIELAGAPAAGLPIVLATTRPDEASPEAEAWTVYGADGRPRQIVIYTESAAFRCANRHPYPDRQCRLKLASILVHEAWHFTRRGDDAGAYEEQLAFLILNEASSVTIASVRRSRDHAVSRRGEARRERVEAGGQVTAPPAAR